MIKTKTSCIFCVLWRTIATEYRSYRIQASTQKQNRSSSSIIIIMIITAQKRMLFVYYKQWKQTNFVFLNKYLLILERNFISCTYWNWTELSRKYTVRAFDFRSFLPAKNSQAWRLEKHIHLDFFSSDAARSDPIDLARAKFKF